MGLTKAQLKKLASVGIVDNPRYPEATGLEEGFDPELVDVVVELNKKGYKTLECCAGHRGGKWGQDTGIIIFNQWIGKHLPEILLILKKHDLKVLKYFLKWPPAIRFEPIGRSALPKKAPARRR
jgi:hypothetical protein